jgi:DNA-binding NtrC family response regulator
MEMSTMDDEGNALTIALPETHVLSLRGGRIEVVGEDTSVPVEMERLQIGRAPSCALVLDDPTVSKVHAEVQATPRGVRVVDLSSLNGTFIGDTSIVEVYLTGPCELRCGAKRLRFVAEATRYVRINAPERFGGLVGTTSGMVELFARLQRYSPTSMSMVIHGETGTGKERVARAIHDASPRRDKPFVAVNCAALTDTLLEAELFGHVRGAFTGADRARDGLFVEADGGTLLFDEVGEMSTAMQAKLLRVLENQEVRPLGTGRSRKVDVRTLFATHADLRHAVNRERFREDLYFRMAQVTVEIPPLRNRMEDLPVLLEDILEQIGRPDMIVDEEGMSALLGFHWPGNVRQLRTTVQAALVESDGERLMVERALPGMSTDVEPERASGLYDQARKEFERRFYTSLHSRYGGNLSQIAKAAGKQRVTVRAALRAIGLYNDTESTRNGTRARFFAAAASRLGDGLRPCVVEVR